jgi:hypothetical protein
MKSLKIKKAKLQNALFIAVFIFPTLNRIDHVGKMENEGKSNDYNIGIWKIKPKNK